MYNRENRIYQKIAETIGFCDFNNEIIAVMGISGELEEVRNYTKPMVRIIMDKSNVMSYNIYHKIPFQGKEDNSLRNYACGGYVYTQEHRGRLREVNERDKE